MPPETFFRSAAAAFANALVIPYYRRKLDRFGVTLSQSRSIQRSSLLAKVRRCADSRFGRIHGFSTIKTVEDFRNRVPISKYDYFAPYIQAVSEGHIEALFPASEKILAFGCTTGTTGEPKLNPITSTWLREYKRSWQVWGVKAIIEHPEMIGTKILQLAGPSRLDQSKTGLSIGMVSAVATRFQSRAIRSFYATPAAVSDIGNSLAKYYTTLRLAMVSPVGFLVAITPANLIRLAEVSDAHREDLIRDIHDGTLCRDIEVPPELRRELDARIRIPRPRRARELERVIERTGALFPKDYWPLSLISCWLGGTVGYQSRDLNRYYGTTPARDLGLVSTEGRHTIPLHDDSPDGVLAVDGSFYEFVPLEEAKSPRRRAFECHELEPGCDYSLVMTTSSGLYRYDIDDVVRCKGYVGEAPLLEFLHKGDHCSDMEGEKISGYQLAQAVEIAARELQLHVDCFTAVAVRGKGEASYYALLVEKPVIEDQAVIKRFLRLVDRQLIRQNVMYAGKRNDNYIGAPKLVRLAAGTWSRFAEAEMRRRGTGDSQYKHPTLVLEGSWLEQFQPVDTVSVDDPGSSSCDHFEPNLNSRVSPIDELIAQGTP